MAIALNQRPTFKRAYKKLFANQREDVDSALRKVIADPLIGEEKKGDLSSVWVYKFNCANQLYLLAYFWTDYSRTWLALGPHENFYRELKRQM